MFGDATFVRLSETVTADSGPREIFLCFGFRFWNRNQDWHQTRSR